MKTILAYLLLTTVGAFPSVVLTEWERQARQWCKISRKKKTSENYSLLYPRTSSKLVDLHLHENPALLADSFKHKMSIYV
ncbi:hypothetical protein GDO86_006876 [Hymenochirus boettgeri]|uniref:Uncharacterized protein n=1 Tax=Hymenochirus boettgeri TaxID=247094 RepID=A0A8T2JCL4_9PIPI|nr:hypothetical protein GDO86_006876 [Hymenochirus boettgeri]